MRERNLIRDRDSAQEGDPAREHELARAKRVFDFIAPVYGLFHSGLEKNYRRALDILRRHYPLGAGTRVLDVGTGTGALAGAFAAVTPHVVATDLSERMLARARPRYGSRIDFRELAAHDLGTFGDGEFDVVTSAFVLHGFDRPYRRLVLAEMNRLARGAVMVIDFIPHHSRLMSLLESLEGSHYQEFMVEFDADLADTFAGYVVEEFTATSGVYVCRPKGTS